MREEDYSQEELEEVDLLEVDSSEEVQADSEERWAQVPRLEAASLVEVEVLLEEASVAEEALSLVEAVVSVQVEVEVLLLLWALGQPGLRDPRMILLPLRFGLFF